MAKKSKKDKEGMLDFRAMLQPSTYDEKNRTIDVTFATDTPVLRYDWNAGENYNEILSFDNGAVRLQRLNEGAPVLDSHASYGIENQLGVVMNARIENGKGVATLKFSEREEIAGVVKDILSGIIRNVSVGYRVFAYEVTEKEGQTTIKRATDWEPFEISMVPIPADFNSHVRKLTNNTNQKTNIMTPEEIKAAADKKEAQKKQRALDLENAKKEGADAAKALEKTRQLEITKAVRSAKIDNQEFLDTLINDDVTIDKARELIIDEIAKSDTVVRGQHAAKVTGEDEKLKRAEAMEIAIEHRVNPSITLTDHAKEFRGLTLMELGRTCLAESGISTRGLAPREVAELSMGLNKRTGSLSSSDFPIILGNTVNRVLRKAYELRPGTFEPFTNRGTAKDFRTMTKVQLGDVTKMAPIVEGAEYTYGYLPESGEAYAVTKYGKIIPITWEMIVNDDLSAFSRIPKSIGVKAKQLQSDIVYAIMKANANMSDGNALFSTAHANLTGTTAGTGTALSVASIQVARTAIRTQKDLNGTDALDLTPMFLITGPTQEQLAYQYTSQNYVATKSADINPQYNTALKVIIDPRITDTAWYLTADPAMIDTIEYSFLEGEELFTEQRIGFDVDGLEIKSRMVFGAKAIDWRGMYKNAGA